MSTTHRILHSSTDRTWRGGEQQVLYTMLGQRERGCETAVVTPPQSELAVRCEEQGLAVFSVAAPSDLYLLAAYRFSRVMREFQPTVLHAHSGRGVSVAAMGRWFSGEQVPLVFSRRVSFPLATHWLSKKKYQAVNRFLPISSQAAEPLVALGIPEERIEVVHEGVDPNRWPERDAAAIRREFSIPEDAFVIGTVGHCDTVKNQKLLLEAVGLILQKYPNVVFFIVGDGAERPGLVQFTKEKGIESSVRLPGFRKDVGSFLDWFDCFVITSTDEGLCTSIIDAQLSRTPVVATNVGGIPELIEHGKTGLLCSSGDHEALSDALLRCIQQPDQYKPMVEQAYQQAMDRFTVDCMVENTLAAYERACLRM